MSFSTHEALSQMELTTLASLRIDEITQRRCHESADGRYCVELLRRATIEQTDQAWSLLQQCFSETIRAWIRNHSSPREVAEVVGYSAGWVRAMVRRWNTAGEQGIKDHRRELPGAKPLLNTEQQAELAEALPQPPSDGGLWSGPKVAAWMQAKVGRPVGQAPPPKGGGL